VSEAAAAGRERERERNERGKAEGRTGGARRGGGGFSAKMTAKLLTNSNFFLCVKIFKTSGDF
jgi:hypothetical protein